VAQVHERERRGRRVLEARMLAHPLGELARQAQVLRHVVAQAARTVGAEHPPQLERAEASAQRELPVA
jgi:hypothetical protein